VEVFPAEFKPAEGATWIGAKPIDPISSIGGGGIRVHNADEGANEPSAARNGRGPAGHFE